MHVAETLTSNEGDFSDPSYVWTGFSVTPTTVTIGDGTTANGDADQTYVREFGSLDVAKVVNGAGYVGTGPNSRSATTVPHRSRGTRTVAAGGSVTILACRRG